MLQLHIPSLLKPKPFVRERRSIGCDKLRQRAHGFLLDEFYSHSFKEWPPYFLEPHITYIAVAFLEFDETVFSLKIGDDTWNSSVPALLCFTDVADILIPPSRSFHG